MVDRNILRTTGGGGSRDTSEDDSDVRRRRDDEPGQLGTTSAGGLRAPDNFDLRPGRDQGPDPTDTAESQAETALDRNTEAALGRGDTVTRTTRTDDGGVRAQAGLTLPGRQDETAARFEDRTGLDRGEDFETSTDLSNAAVESDERRTTAVDLTEQGRDELTDEQDSDDSDTVVGGLLSGAADAADNVPGSDAVGDVAGDIAGAESDLTEPVRERLAAGVDAVGSSAPVSGTVDVASDVGSAVGEASADAADRVNSFGPDEISVAQPVGTTVVEQEVTNPFQTGAAEEAVDLTVGAPSLITGSAATAADATRETGENIAEEGLLGGSATSAAAAGGVAASGLVAAERGARENPAATLGQLATGAVAGTAAVRGAERGIAAGRVASRTRGDRDAIDFEDITSERGAKGELPQFETDRRAPTSEAVDEVRDRARDAPDALQDRLGDEVLFRSESERLPGDLETQPGESELPGLFTSPDASPLRATVNNDRSGGLRLPFTGGATRPETFSAFETDDIRGIPDRAAGSGRVSGPDAGTDTPGGRFLTNEAERGAAFVRPQGDRTGELEAIVPPGTAFERTGATRLRGVGGGTLDLFERRGGRDADDLDLDRAPGERGDGDAELFTASEIRARERRSRNDETPLSPPASGAGTTLSRGPQASSAFNVARRGGGETGDGAATDTATPAPPARSALDATSSTGGAESDTGATDESVAPLATDTPFTTAPPGESPPPSPTATGGGQSVGASFISGDSSSGSRTPRLDTNDDDGGLFDISEDSPGPEAPFTNPVETPTEVLSGRANPGGRRGDTDEDGLLSPPSVGGESR